MSDVRQRISDVLCNRLADLDVAGGRYVADNLAETLTSLPGITILDTVLIEQAVEAYRCLGWSTTTHRKMGALLAAAEVQQ